MTVRDVLRSVASLVPAGARSALDAPGLDVPCTGVVYDSRAVRPGSVFVALQGLRADGAAFAPQAIAAGWLPIWLDRKGMPGGGPSDERVIVVTRLTQIQSKLD